jgi:hypothetical protein
MAAYSRIKVRIVGEGFSKNRESKFDGRELNRRIVEEASAFLENRLNVPIKSFYSADGSDFDINIFPAEPLMNVGKFGGCPKPC